MLKEIKFILIYFMCFIGFSVVSIKLFDKNPDEMVAYVLWGDLFYAGCCFIPWIIINKFSFFIKSNWLRQIVRFFAGLLTLRIFIAFMGGVARGNLKILLAINIIYTLSFLIASAGYTGSRDIPIEAEQEN